MSIRITSGRSSRVRSTASCPLRAWPTTAIRRSVREDRLERLGEEMVVVGDEDGDRAAVDGGLHPCKSALLGSACEGRRRPRADPEAARHRRQPAQAGRRRRRKARESYEAALAVAREAGLEDTVRPLVEVRLADLDRLASSSTRRNRPARLTSSGNAPRIRSRTASRSEASAAIARRTPVRDLRPGRARRATGRRVADHLGRARRRGSPTGTQPASIASASAMPNPSWREAWYVGAGAAVQGVELLVVDAAGQAHVRGGRARRSSSPASSSSSPTSTNATSGACAAASTKGRRPLRSTADRRDVGHGQRELVSSAPAAARRTDRESRGGRPPRRTRCSPAAPRGCTPSSSSAASRGHAPAGDEPPDAALLVAVPDLRRSAPCRSRRRSGATAAEEACERERQDRACHDANQQTTTSARRPRQRGREGAGELADGVALAQEVGVDGDEARGGGCRRGGHARAPRSGALDASGVVRPEARRAARRRSPRRCTAPGAPRASPAAGSPSRPRRADLGEGARRLVGVPLGSHPRRPLELARAPRRGRRGGARSAPPRARRSGSRRRSPARRTRSSAV